jgi:nifR3 family TIM-barrel protein
MHVMFQKFYYNLAINGGSIVNYQKQDIVNGLSPVLMPVLALAPLAGYTNPEFRLLALKWGADLVYSEMISSRGLIFGGCRTFELMERHSDEKNLFIQLFGDDPQIMGEAAAVISESGIADGIDLNFGCPVKKVAKSGSGAVLMKTPEVACAITEAVVRHSKVPVSIKFRLGWNDDAPAAKEFLDIAAQCKCCHAMIHGRWATQFYRGESDWAALAELTSYARLPVFVNGDVCSAEDALKITELTGAAGIGVGRGALRRPWIFSEIKSSFSGETFREVPEDNLLSRIEIARWLLKATAWRLDSDGLKAKGYRKRPAPAYIRLRGHFMALISSVDGASKIRQSILAAKSDKELDLILEELSVGGC